MIYTDEMYIAELHDKIGHLKNLLYLARHSVRLELDIKKSYRSVMPEGKGLKKVMEDIDHALEGWKYKE